MKLEKNKIYEKLWVQQEEQKRYYDQSAYDQPTLNNCQKEDMQNQQTGTWEKAVVTGYY